MPRGKRRKRNILHSVEFPPLRMRDSSCVSLGWIHELGRFAFVACSMGSFVWVLLCWVTSRCGKELSEPSLKGPFAGLILITNCRVYSMGIDWGLIQEVYCCVSGCWWNFNAAPSVDRRFKSVTCFGLGEIRTGGWITVCPKGMQSTSIQDSNLVDSASSIRLSQRLSHACLSINNFIRETANGSLYQL